MSCCGKAREQAAGGPARPLSIGMRSAPGPAAPASRREPPAAMVAFEYVGDSALTATGPVTGRRYRFAAPGARVLIDVRDAPALRQVPRLRPG